MFKFIQKYIPVNKNKLLISGAFVPLIHPTKFSMYVFYLQMLWNCFFKNQLNNTQSSTPVILSMLGLVVFNSLYIHVLRNNHTRSAFFLQFFLIFNNMIFKLFDYQNFHIFTNAKSSHLNFFFSKCIFYHAKSVFFRKVINQTSKWHNYLIL